MASTRNHMDPLNLRLNLKLRLSHLLPWTSHSEKSMGNLNPVHCWAHPFPILPPFTVLCFFLLDVPSLSLYLSFCSLALCSRRLQHHLPGLSTSKSILLWCCWCFLRRGLMKPRLPSILIMWRMTLNFWSFCFHLPNSGITLCAYVWILCRAED